MQIVIVPKRETRAPTPLSAQLKIDHWNDFSFVTMFQVTLYDETLTPIELGSVKIGFKGQTEDVSTYERLQPSQTELPEDFFSLGTDIDYYSNLWSCETSIRQTYLAAMRDIVSNPGMWSTIEDESVLATSLMRSVSLAAIQGQFHRVLNGGAALTNFKFRFVRQETERIGSVDLSFEVKAESSPSTNIHALIGRNGSGKTTLLNGMVTTITEPQAEGTGFYTEAPFAGPVKIDPGFFSGIVSVSFSAFDPFPPPPEQPDPTKGPRYAYIGIKDQNDAAGRLLKSMDDMEKEFVASLSACWGDQSKKRRWAKVVEKLKSDENFARMNLDRFLGLGGDALKKEGLSVIGRMSAGHTIVLLILTRLVENVEEKTLVLMDEPESHLHPPLLSAFTRAISELLYDRNGVAIVATHSPVILQEVPRSCVWKISRIRMATACLRPEIETFGENVGVLTHEVFGLEVSKSGFHALLAEDVQEGLGYQDVLARYNGQLGLEAQGVLHALIAKRDVDAR